ncbi:MAG TPA: hypothetical protein VIM94_06325 [Salegentibacter sp.]|uniref:hypothetical protein n=1 Tax=Salegentibacter sp. TaxID=1903072 RepID=UPI002F92EA2F
MKTLQLYIITLVTVLFTSSHLKGQTHTDKAVVKQIYDVLQNKNPSSQEIAALKAGINWDEVNPGKAARDKYSISLSAIMNNAWGNIMFDDLKFQIPEKNKVLVTGIVNGRQATECEYISSRFKHSWSLQGGKIVGFVE